MRRFEDVLFGTRLVFLCSVSYGVTPEAAPARVSHFVVAFMPAVIVGTVLSCFPALVFFSSRCMFSFLFLVGSNLSFSFLQLRFVAPLKCYALSSARWER